MNVTRNISHLSLIPRSIVKRIWIVVSVRKSERQTFDGFALGDCMLQLAPHDFTTTAYGHTISSVNTFART